MSELTPALTSRLHKYTQKWLGLAILVVATVVGLGGYYLWQRIDATSQQVTAEKILDDEAKELKEIVGELVKLPEDELPAIATVTDVSELQDQVFFQDATNDDKVLIFQKAKIAVLYRPDLGKIINMGPLTTSNSQAEGIEASPTPQAKIVLRNGTSVARLAANTQEKLLEAFPGAVIISREQASRSDYDTTIVVVLNPEAESAAQVLATHFNSEVVNLPEGEEKPTNGDIVVILGKDQTIYQ